MKRLDTIVNQVINHLGRSSLTIVQQTQISEDIEHVCKTWKDGYDRARALELGRYWTKLDAKLVAILHEE